MDMMLYEVGGPIRVEFGVELALAKEGVHGRAVGSGRFIQCYQKFCGVPFCGLQTWIRAGLDGLGEDLLNI